ncbi:MAG: carbon storage regulator CsrA [Chloroflexota bacterium]
MLVLTRKVNEALNINHDEIVITVLAVEGERVKLGIVAPKSVSILRQELCEQVGQENHAAALSLEESNRRTAHLRESLLQKVAA